MPKRSPVTTPARKRLPPEMHFLLSRWGRLHFRLHSSKKSEYKHRHKKRIETVENYAAKVVTRKDSAAISNSPLHVKPIERRPLVFPIGKGPFNKMEVYGE